MSRPQDLAQPRSATGTRTGAALRLVRLGRWTFLDPIQVRRAVEAGGSGRTVRWLWCGLAAALGGILSPLAGATDLPGALVLPAIAALLALVASLDLHSEGLDALGVMVLSLALFVFPMPAAMAASRPQGGSGWVWAVTFIPLFALGLGFGWKISQAALNRAFLFWPVGLAMVALTALSPSGSLPGRLASAAGAEPARFEGACLLLVLFALKLAGPQASIGSFTHMAGTETCHAIPVTAYRRYLVLAYVSFSAAFLVLHLVRPSPRMALLALALALGAVLEMDLPAYLGLSLWLRRGAVEPASREPLLFATPVLPFEPVGLRSYLRRVRAAKGTAAAGELAVEIFLRTGYRHAAERTLEEIDRDEPFLSYHLRQRLEAEVPRDPREPADAQAAPPAVRAAAPMMAPALTAITAQGLDSAGIQGMLFFHRYEPPRGREGAPLMALPIWFPVTAPPRETLTLEQVLYRSLGSVREPFRRSRILLPDVPRMRATYTEILDWAVDWAGASLGASLIPVPLSLARLAGCAADLEALAQRLSRERAAAQAGTGPAPSSGCREILDLGLAASPGGLADLTAALEAGNAWLLVEDDRDGDSDLKPVQAALNAVFGTAGLSHTAVVLLTACKGCHILSDMQTFLDSTDQPAPRKMERRTSGPGSFTATLCRLLSRLGSPGAKPVLLAAVVLGLGLLALVLLRYEELLRLPSLFSRTHLLRAGLLYLGLLSPMIAGYIWGLAWGSEEVRRSSVDEMILLMLAFGSLFLVPLPRAMDPGLLKSACIVLASLPAAFLVPMAALGVLSLAANVLWLILSVRLCRRLGADGLAALAERYHIVLHLAHFSAELPLPRGRSRGTRLPLLVAFRNREILAGLLPVFPALAQQLRTVVLTGIRKDSEPYSVSAASLVLEALAGEEDEPCQSCLREIAAGCAAAWPDREEFGEYSEPSTSFTMNALEYVARRLCYLTNLEELIVVR